MAASHSGTDKVQGLSSPPEATGSPLCPYPEEDTSLDTERDREEEGMDATYRRALRVVLGHVETKVSSCDAAARRLISSVPDSSP